MRDGRWRLRRRKGFGSWFERMERWIEGEGEIEWEIDFTIRTENSTREFHFFIFNLQLLCQSCQWAKRSTYKCVR